MRTSNPLYIRYLWIINFIVYSHVNKITNVTYVGITKRKPELRWANGFGYKTNPYF